MLGCVKLDEECPYQVVLPRQQLTDDSEVLDFLLAYVGTSSTCMSKTTTRPSCSLLLRSTRWTRKFSAPASSRRSRRFKPRGMIAVIAMEKMSGGDSPSHDPAIDAVHKPTAILF